MLPRSNSIPTSPRADAVLLLVILLTHAILLAWGGACHSPVWDEPGHLLAGVSHWQFGTFDLYRVNPPLVRMVAALPVLAAGVRTDWSNYDPTPGARSERMIRADFVRVNGIRIFWLHTLARWACIPFSVVGAVTCYCWARELYGRGPGLLAATLWSFCPNILGHAQLFTPDAAGSAMGVLAAYLFWRWLGEPSVGRALAAGLGLGFAELSKSTWLVLFLLWPLVWFALRGIRLGFGLRWLGEAAQLAAALGLAVYLLNAAYGFEGTGRVLGEYQFVSRAFSGMPHAGTSQGPYGNRFARHWTGRIPLPLPANYVMGIDLQKSDFERPTFSYLRGQWRHEGWWYYYLYALAVKVPIGTWGLLLLTLVGVLRPWHLPRARNEFLILAPAATVLVLVSSQTGMNHHMRYVLPVLPFGFVWTSKVAHCFRHNIGVSRLAGGLLCWSIVSSLYAYPHGLSYFNELAGGPLRGRFHLDNSNVDWGQDLFYLKWWCQSHPEARPIWVRFCVPFIDPRAAGIDCHVLPPFQDRSAFSARSPEQTEPAPGWYVLSTNILHGLAEDCGYFMRFTPVATAGYSIYIYHITPEEANRVRRELGLPPLPDDWRPAAAEIRAATAPCKRPSAGTTCPPSSATGKLGSSSCGFRNGHATPPGKTPSRKIADFLCATLDSQQGGAQ